MAAVEELETAVLCEDESETDVPAPAQGKVKKFALMAGLCLAAVFVGAAVFKPGVQGSMPRAAAPVGGFTVLSSYMHQFSHMSAQCVSEMMELEQDYTSASKQHTGSGWDLDCDEDDQVCKTSFGSMAMSKCFPTSCKEKNIENELNGDPGKPPSVPNVTVHCSPGEGGSSSSSDSEYVFQHLQPKCQSALKSLEDKYKDAGKDYENFDGHDLTCDDDDKTCKCSIKPDGQVLKMSKCFPKVCKTKNIRKEVKAAFGVTKVRLFCGR